MFYKPISINYWHTSSQRLGHINQGAGVAIGDIDKNGRPDMILMGIDNPKGKNNFWYKVLYDIDENGYYSKESSILSISAEGWEILEVISPSVI